MNNSKIFIAASLLLCVLLITSCSSGVKDIDGKVYKTVQIGSQVWMAENFSASHFRNGDSIQQVKTQEEWVRFGQEGKPAWCYMENNSENGTRFGKLYNWYAASDPRGLAPRGWHVATDADWTGIINFLGGGVMAATQLRTTGLADYDKNKNDQPGFSGLPGGCRNSFGNFYGSDSFGYWWSSTEVGQSDAWVRILNYVKCDINSKNFSKTYGTSIRCVRD